MLTEEQAQRKYLLGIWQNLPLNLKVRKTQARIKEWYESHDGMVYVSFSGGKDSTALLHLVRDMYPDVPAVFVDTGLEYPEIRQFVKRYENVTIIRPKMPFHEVIKKHGYPIVSKKVAHMVRYLQRPTEKNAPTRHLTMTGIHPVTGKEMRFWKLPEKWKPLIDAPFPVSDACCDVMKKRPFHAYNKSSGRFPFIGTMTADSEQRAKTYVRSGCNAFNAKHPSSQPMAFWKDGDVWQYLKENNVPYCDIYDKGETRTGCVFCMFGVHMDGEPNRFQRLKQSHPKMHDYCMDRLGIRKCLEFIDVPCE